MNVAAVPLVMFSVCRQYFQFVRTIQLHAGYMVAIRGTTERAHYRLAMGAVGPIIDEKFLKGLLTKQESQKIHYGHT